MTATDTTLVAPDRCTRYRSMGATEPASYPGHHARPRRLLGIWAHPDDESYLSAGLMARTVERGGTVTVVALTDGEAGFPAEDDRPSHGRARQRRRELCAAMARIGVTDVRFLALGDGGVAERVDGALVDTIGDLVHEVAPDLTVTFGPDGITGHDDHVATWRLVTRAWAATGTGDLWYAAPPRAWLDEWRRVHDEMGVWMTGEPDGIDPSDAVMALELAGGDLDRKRAVLREHGSQTGSVASMLGEEGYRRWIRRETFRLPTAADFTAALSSPTGATLVGSS